MDWLLDRQEQIEDRLAFGTRNSFPARRHGTNWTSQAGVWC
jgi:hypothetical protein